MLDITERKRAEEALRRSERDLSDFFDNASVGLHWVGPDGVILRVNQTELDLLGYSREEYLGHHITEFHVGQTAIQDILTRLTRGEALREYPAQLRCKDGSMRDVLINSNVLFEAGQFIHTRCFTRDVTEQKQAEEALRHSHAELRAHVEELARFNQAMVGRELRMIELKKEINELRDQQGHPARYPLEFEEGESTRPEPVNGQETSARGL